LLVGFCDTARVSADGRYAQDEERRLLYDENSGMQYDSFGDQALNGENDTIETQRENEALQRVVAKTSRYAHIFCLEGRAIDNPTATWSTSSKSRLKKHPHAKSPAHSHTLARALAWPDTSISSRSSIPTRIAPRAESRSTGCQTTTTSRCRRTDLQA
jgi:hypothetical protein